MGKFHVFLLVTFLQCISSYHHLPPPRDLLDLRNNDQDVYSNFDNFDTIRRRSRQPPRSNGFDWDEASWSLNQNNFDRPRASSLSSSRSRNQDDDGFIFEDEFENRYDFSRSTERNIYTEPTRRYPTTTRRNVYTKPTRRPFSTTTVAIPGMGTPRTPCEDRCQTTPEYNPVCGDDDMTYFSRSRLICAQKCGKRVKMKHMGACTLIPPRG